MPSAKLLWECYYKEMMDGQQWAVCYLCGKRLRIMQRSTSSMRYHLRSQHPERAAELQQQDRERIALLQLKEDMSGFDEEEIADGMYEGESSSGHHQMDPLPMEMCEKDKPQPGRRKATLLWEYFDKQMLNGQTWAICKICETQLKIINSSTTHARYHLRSKHPKRAAMLQRKEMMAKRKHEEEKAARAVIQSEDYAYETDPSAYQDASFQDEEIIVESTQEEEGYHLPLQLPEKSTEPQNDEILDSQLMDERSDLVEVEDEEVMFEANQSGSVPSTSLPKRRQLMDPSDAPYVSDYYEKQPYQDQKEEVYYRMEGKRQLAQKIYNSLSNLDPDVRIHCSDGKIIRANRQVLSLGSLLFRSIFSTDCNCVSHFPIVYDILCPDIGSKILGKVLGSFETGEPLIGPLSEVEMEEVRWIIDTFQVTIPFEFVVSEETGNLNWKSTPKESHKSDNIKIHNYRSLYRRNEIIQDKNIEHHKGQNIKSSFVKRQNTNSENFKVGNIQHKNVTNDFNRREQDSEKFNNIQRIKERIAQSKKVEDQEQNFVSENENEHNIKFETFEDCEIISEYPEENKVKNKTIRGKTSYYNL